MKQPLNMFETELLTVYCFNTMWINYITVPYMLYLRL